MKKLISLCLTLCLLFGFNVYAETNETKLEYQGFFYEIIESEQQSYVIITGINENGTNETLVIPSLIDGREVREIGDYAFSQAKIKKAIIPGGIIKIGNYAFSNCSELESIELPNTIEEFGSCAFSFCTKLTDFLSPSSLKKIGTSAFCYCTNLQNLYLNEGLEEIGAGAIANCDKLTEIVIPSTVQTISVGGMMPIIEYCNALETIELKCKYKCSQIFVADCPNLKEVVFYEDIGDFDYNGTFKYSFYACKPRVKFVNPREYTTPLDVTLKAKKDSNVEKFAIENGFKFIALESEQNEPSVWAKLEIDEAIEIGFVPLELQNNYTQSTTREEFAHLAVNFVMKNLFLSFEELQSQAEKYSAPRIPFDDSNDKYILLAARMGIIKGIGNNLFDPMSPITREQAATMLQRTYSLYSNGQNQMHQAVFGDSEKISEWAVGGVEFCVSYDVMKGISDTHFASQGYYTKEQAIATFLRLYKVREWEEQNHLAKYKKKISKEETIASFIKNNTEYVSTVVDNEYGVVVYFKKKLAQML